LWAHANPDSYSCANADSNTYRYSNSYAYTDSYAYGYSYGYAYTHSYGYSDSNGYAYADTYADGYDPAKSKPDTKAKCDTAASPVSGSGKLIVHSAAGVERPRLRAFVRQAFPPPGDEIRMVIRLPACLISQKAR
jgi:hypothetical protein